MRTNRSPDAEFLNVLKGNKVDFDLIPESTQKLVIEHLGTAAEAKAFFDIFEFCHSERCTDNLEIYLQGQLIPSDTGMNGWLLLKNQAKQWSIQKNLPEPDGKILYHHLVQIITKARTQPISQDFQVPKSYCIPNQEFHNNFLNRLITEKSPLTVLWGTPGRGKSTYISFLIQYLEEQKYPVIRHHYFLSLADNYTNRIGFNEISDSLQYQIQGKYPEAVRGIPQNSPDLRKWLEVCGAHYKKENKPFFVFIDGLDHVWREQQDTAQLNHLCNHILPCPDNVIIIFGTQKVSDDKLSYRLLQNVTLSDWIALPPMDEGAVHNWLENQDRNGQILWPEYIAKDDSRRSEELPKVAKAFFDISYGHPLHLIYSFESLVRRGVNFTTDEVQALASCPDGDIQTYYKGLWVRISAAARQVLHMIAGTDFKWTVAGIRYCAGHGLEEIDFLFEHQRTGVMPFHGSILAYIREQPDHIVTYTATLPRIIEWLENEAPEYLNWGWLWRTKAKNGDSSSLLQGATRNWLIDSIAKGWPISEMIEVFSLAEKVAFEQRDYCRTIELRSLKTRLINGPEFQTNQFSIFQGIAIKASANQAEVNNLTDDMPILKYDEVVMLAYATSSSEIRDKCFEKLRTSVNNWVNLRNASQNDFSRLLSSLLEVVALQENGNLKEALDFIFTLNDGDAYFYELIGHLSREGRLDKLIEILCFSHAEVKGRRRITILDNIVRLSCLDMVDISKRLASKTLLGSPLLACWLQIKGYPVQITQHIQITAKAIKEKYEYGANPALEKFFHSVFFSSLSTGLLAEGDYSFILPGITLASERLNSFINTFNDAAKDISKGDLGLAFESIYLAFGSIEPSKNDNSNEAVEYRALTNALRSIATDLYCLGCTKNPKIKIGSDAFQFVRASVHWSDEMWLYIYSQNQLPLLEQDAVNSFLDEMLEKTTSKVTQFNERMDSYIELSKAGILTEYPVLSDVLKRAASCLIGYGHRKDVEIFDILDGIEQIHNHKAYDVSTWLKTLCPIIDQITEFTDGKETRHSKRSFIQLLTIVSPERLPDCYAYYTSQDEYYLAEEALNCLMQKIDLSTPVCRALGRTLVGVEEIKELGELSKENSSAKEIYDEQAAYIGGLGGLTSDSRSNRTQDSVEKKSEKAIPDITQFEPAKFKDFLGSMSDFAFDYKLREDVLKKWAHHWKDKGKGIELLKVLEAYFNADETAYGSDSILDDAFLISLEIEGKNAAYKWLVKAHISDNGWASYWSSEEKIMRRLEWAATHYKDKWQEYIFDTSKPATRYQKRRFSFSIGGKYLVRFLLLVGQTQAAVEFTQTCINILIDEVSDQPIPKSTWLH